MSAFPAFRGAGRPVALAGWLAIAWIVLVLVAVTIQAHTYTGWVAQLTEWQFDRMGQSFPTATFLLLFALCAIPGFIVLALALRRSHTAQSLSALDIALARAVRMQHVLTGLAILVAIAAIVAVVQMAQLPSAAGVARSVDAGTVANSVQPQGPVVLVGRYRYDRTATFGQNVLVARRDYHYVPVQSARGPEAQALAVFAEIDGNPAKQGAIESHTGVLRHNSLPPEVAQLYRDAGFTVSSAAYVLYSAPETMRWPYLAAAGQLALAALVLGIAAWLTRRRVWALKVNG